MRHRVLNLAAGVLLIALAGCSTTGHSASPPPMSSIAIPAAEARTPTLVVAGTVSWTGPHPGCPTLTIPSGQVFHLTGLLAQNLAAQARSGAPPSSGPLEVAGYVPERADIQSPCGKSPPFVLEKVTVSPR